MDSYACKKEGNVNQAEQGSANQSKVGVVHKVRVGRRLGGRVHSSLERTGKMEKEKSR